MPLAALPSCRRRIWYPSPIPAWVLALVQYLLDWISGDHHPSKHGVLSHLWMEPLAVLRLLVLPLAAGYLASSLPRSTAVLQPTLAHQRIT